MKLRRGAGLATSPSFNYAGARYSIKRTILIILACVLAKESTESDPFPANPSLPKISSAADGKRHTERKAMLYKNLEELLGL